MRAFLLELQTCGSMYTTGHLEFLCWPVPSPNLHPSLLLLEAPEEAAAQR